MLYPFVHLCLLLVAGPSEQWEINEKQWRVVQIAGFATIAFLSFWV